MLQKSVVEYVYGISFLVSEFLAVKREINQRPNTVEVIGRACRLPGARNIAEFWTLLTKGECSVSQIGQDRFSLFRYLHPSAGTDGKSYTFRAGVLDDVWNFDPAVFALSPREAMQMDPQQRLLLMLVWEALEEAGLPPSNVAGVLNFTEN